MQRFKQFLGRLGLKMILFLSRRLHINLLNLGLAEEGYTKSYSFEASGELHFVAKVLPQVVGAKTKPVFFDVGSNVGQYATLLRQFHPAAVLHCFEPNAHTFETLKKNSLSAILNNCALGSSPGEAELFFDTTDKTTVQASFDKIILRDIGGKNELQSLPVKIRTLDEYCRTGGIDRIDFLKIDTEGHELETLHGASQMLGDNKITCIQFEFNEVNIVKRRFLRDFYELLPHYDFFRLDQDRMIPMGAWNANHEIFRFQNIVAVMKGALKS